jgi:hypothetical protein
MALGAWIIWKHWNDCFNGASPSVQRDLKDLPAQSEDNRRGRICICVFIGVSVHALQVSELYCVIKKNVQRDYAC